MGADTRAMNREGGFVGGTSLRVVLQVRHFELCPRHYSLKLPGFEIAPPRGYYLFASFRLLQASPQCRLPQASY